ncbi:UDP-N-acetylmuramoyl-L-alanine--D-glutamate ligase [soil metagenome]
MKVLVLGGAVSGRAAARLASRLGHDVALYDRTAAATHDLPEGVAAHQGAWDPELLGGVDLVVTSPGIPEGAPPVADALATGVPLVSELEFGASHLEVPYVAVTGTNGKTTVTEAAAAMLGASGMRSVAAGNVGLALCDVVGEPWDVVAVEASSFQLRFIDRFHPSAAAILNIAPDHLDWHADLEGYAAAKARIHENQGKGDLVAYPVDDPVAAAAAAGARSRRVPVSGTHRPPGGNGPEGGRVHIEDLDFPVPHLDPVWLYDLTVAGTLARSQGATAAGIGSVIEGFGPGPHRRRVVAVRHGVTWVDDSKATNPHAAAAAASAYPSVVLIAGGRNKGLDLAPMLAVPTIRRVLAIGEATDELVAAGGELVTPVIDMAAAVELAAAIARPGDTVLLAPGCASFDMFDDYAHRGEVFAGAVAGLEEADRDR